MTSNKSHFWKSPDWRHSKNEEGSDSPKKVMSGLTRPLHSSQMGMRWERSWERTQEVGKDLPHPDDDVGGCGCGCESSDSDEVGTVP